ncbi:MAG TPA: DUF4249 family protein, partial [Bacteroidales bacterium]|nr:DUF4249 family protein [Bacteroidales bacterium]
MKYTKIIYTVVLLLTVLGGANGCTEPIELEGDDMNPKLVITGTLSTEPGYQIIEISSTVPYFGTDLPVNIDAARVLLNDMVLIRDAPGIYTTGGNFAAVEGETYLLEVWIDFDGDGQEEYYSATTTVPYVHVLESLSVRSLIPGEVDVPFILLAGFQDTPGEDYYGAALWINDDLYSNRILR